MCKRHWKEIHQPPPANSKVRKEDEKKRVEPRGMSVYDDVLPRSFMWTRMPRVVMDSSSSMKRNSSKRMGASLDNKKDSNNSASTTEEYEISTQMPLAKLLQDNATAEAGWHRRAECLARGIQPPKSLKCKLEEWEAQMAIIEMGLLVGVGEHNSGDDKYQRLLGHAWGRDGHDFRKHLVNRLCSRRGDLKRKQRIDVGKTISEEERAVIRVKANATKAENRRKRKLLLEEEATVGDDTAGSNAQEVVEHKHDQDLPEESNGDATNLISSNDDDKQSSESVSLEYELDHDV